MGAALTCACARVVVRGSGTAHGQDTEHALRLLVLSSLQVRASEQ